MTIPTKFETIQRASASYDWQDFVAGIGYITYYLGAARNDPASGTEDSHFLTRSTSMASDFNLLQHVGGSGDFNFDIDVTNSFTLGKGTAVFNTGLVSHGASEAFNVTVTLKRVRDGNEVDIASGGRNLTVSSQNRAYAIPVIIPRSVGFVTGDILRLTTEDIGDAVWYTDPSGRTEGVEATTNATLTGSSFITLPFAIDI